MKPIKDESFDLIDSFRMIEKTVPAHRVEYAGWQVFMNVDHGVRNVVDVWLWGPVMSKVERMHGL